MIVLTLTRRYWVIIVFVCFFLEAKAQNNRIANHNTIGWYNLFTTAPLHKKWSLHGEFQMRRADGWEKGQQNLLRTGINYQHSPQTLFRVGYAYIDTYPYGEIPLNGMGKPFAEHRLFEMIQYTMQSKQLAWVHRWMLEQRWVGRYSQPQLQQEDQFPLLNRLRYQVRLQKNWNDRKDSEKSTYLAVYDEIMIGFGKNVGENIFDQNRLGLLFGRKFSNKWRLEAGFLSQILQLGREVNGSNVFQYNNGWVINLISDFRKPKKE